MRNPWDRDDDFTGEWRDGSPLWSQNNYASQVPYTNNVWDGNFFVTIQEFYDNFYDFTIAHFYDSWMSSVVSHYNDDGTMKTFLFTLDKDSDGFIGFDFYERRFYPTGCMT